MIRYNEINNILSKWNPIDVDEDISTEEYKAYVQGIFQLIKIGDDAKLKKHLIDALLEMGLEYSEDNVIQRTDLDFVCKEFMELRKYL